MATLVAGGSLTAAPTEPSSTGADRGDALADLVARASRGEPDAFGELYDELSPGALRFLRGLRLGLGREQLEDALQESFLRLLRRLSGLHEPRRVRSYLLGIAHHVAVDVARLGPPPPVVEEEPPGRGPDPAVRLEGAERDTIVGAALDALPHDLRGALALRHVAGLTMQDLALALSCSVPTARARLNEAASRLALELRRRGIDPREVRA
jgi:RNA polymerase sigma-70 factor, ECF subfamily